MDKLFYSFLVFIALVFTGFTFVSNQNGSIVLKDEPVPVTPAEFYVANVVDERNDRTAVASLSCGPAESYPKAMLSDFEGGGFAAIKRFIDHNLPRNTDLRPITIGIKKFMASEVMFPDKHIEGNIAVIMSFYINTEDGETLHLLDYKANTKYKRSDGPPQDIEPALRHMLENGLIYLNTWMNKQAPANIMLAKAVEVSFTDHRENPEGDTIYYSVNRPLTWDDFKGSAPPNKYAAEVWPTIGYDERTEVNNAVIRVNLDIKVDIPKSDCQVRENSRDDYILNHEQRHFDIAKIAAEHFKQKIKTENLPVANFDGPINSDYLDAYREMDSLQKKYDQETMHGTNNFAQEQWNERIDKELKTLGVRLR